MTPLPAPRTDPGRARLKALLLATGLLFIAMAYYLVKTASRSIILQDAGSSILPYIWIGSALTMLLLVPVYQWIVAHTSRFTLLFGTLTGTVGALLAFYFQFDEPSVTKAALFYGFSDIVGVMIVEQFWSLTNSEFQTYQARRWYGLISSGGLVGGLLAGIGGAQLVERLGLATTDLLLVSVALIVAALASVGYMLSTGVFRSEHAEPITASFPEKAADRLTRENNYLLLVAVILLMAQLAGPFIEYQFMSLVDERFVDQDRRTVYLSHIFSWINGVALLVNLALTSLIHRRFGAIGGLAVRPLAVLAGSAVFLAFPVVQVAALLRVLDKALAYSVNRASREMLYVPMSSQTVYIAKAWIDMLGFRLFKVFGSGAIILLTTGLREPFTLGELSVVVIGICLSWTAAIITIRGRYQRLVGVHADSAAPAGPLGTPPAEDPAAA